MILPDINIFYVEIGERIRTERLKKKLTHQELADHLGLTRVSVINIETGKHKPSIYQLLQISKLFEINYSKLIPAQAIKSKVKGKRIDLDMRNVVSDQKISHNSTISTINNFLSTLKK